MKLLSCVLLVGSIFRVSRGTVGRGVRLIITSLTGVNRSLGVRLTASSPLHCGGPLPARL